MRGVKKYFGLVSLLKGKLRADLLARNTKWGKHQGGNRTI